VNPFHEIGGKGTEKSRNAKAFRDFIFDPCQFTPTESRYSAAISSAVRPDFYSSLWAGEGGILLGGIAEWCYNL